MPLTRCTYLNCFFSKLFFVCFYYSHSQCFSEELSEDESFSERRLASIVASKVFYHLEELDDALKYALSAGDLFDIGSQSEYTETLIGKSSTVPYASFYSLTKCLCSQMH